LQNFLSNNWFYQLFLLILRYTYENMVNHWSRPNGKV
jgi:hypothetical protein